MTFAPTFALLAFSNLLAPLLGMALVLTISRLGGLALLGQYALLSTVLVLGQSCIGLGLPVVVTREVAQRGRAAAGICRAACALSVLAAALALPLAALALRATGDAALRDALGLIVLALLPTALVVQGEAALLGLGRAGDLVAIQCGESALRAALGVALVALGGGILALAAATLGLRLLAAVAMLWTVRRHGVTLVGRLPRGTGAALAREVPVLGAIPVVNALYARADVFLLTWLGTWTELGLYSAALRLVDVVRAIAPAFARALYPVLARLHGESPPAFAARGRQALRDGVVLVLPAALALSVLADPLLALLYGAPAAAGAPALRLLAWTLVTTIAAATLAQVLFAARLPWLDLRINLIACAAILALGAWTVPRWGAAGAAAATLAASTLYAALQVVAVRGAAADPAAGGLLLRVLAVACAAALALVAVPAPLPGAALALAAALLAACATGLVRPDDLARLRALWTHRRAAAAPLGAAEPRL